MLPQTLITAIGQSTQALLVALPHCRNSSAPTTLLQDHILCVALVPWHGFLLAGDYCQQKKSKQSPKLNCYLE